MAGNALQVTQQSGTATVDFNGSTAVTEVTGAALTDVTSGSCVAGRIKDEGQAAISLSPSANGRCPDGGGPHRR